MTEDRLVFRLMLGLLGGLVCLISLSSCQGVGASEERESPRLAMFVGVDVSGSFLKSRYYDDSMSFLANYVYAHLNGYGGLEIPKSLFIGSLGGANRSEAKTFFPIEVFQNKSVEEIRGQLARIFPKNHEDPYTDFNAFFRQVEETVKNKKLILRPISIVLLSDGVPDFPGSPKGTGHSVNKIDLKPLELLSRNVTVRLLYTSAVVGSRWQNDIRRQRVKIWTQDGDVMVTWKDPRVLLPGVALPEQQRLYGWIKDNVDFPVPLKRVD